MDLPGRNPRPGHIGGKSEEGHLRLQEGDRVASRRRRALRLYCESAARLLSECGMEDEGYFAALVRMFDQALVVMAKLDPSERRTLLQRLDAVRSAADA